MGLPTRKKHAFFALAFLGIPLNHRTFQHAADNGFSVNQILHLFQLQGGQMYEPWGHTRDGKRASSYFLPMRYASSLLVVLSVSSNLESFLINHFLSMSLLLGMTFL